MPLVSGWSGILFIWLCRHLLIVKCLHVQLFSTLITLSLVAHQAGREERKWLSISRTFSLRLMSTLNMAPDFRVACEGWHFHTQQHLVTTHDVPSTWLLTSLSMCVRMLNALWQSWRRTYSVTKQSKPFLRKCPTIMRYFLYMPLLPLIC